VPGIFMFQFISHYFMCFLILRLPIWRRLSPSPPSSNPWNQRQLGTLLAWRWCHHCLSFGWGSLTGVCEEWDQGS
jgi:hypothetical protein